MEIFLKYTKLFLVSLPLRARIFPYNEDDICTRCREKKYVHAVEARLNESLVYFKKFSILNLNPLIN